MKSSKQKKKPLLTAIKKYIDSNPVPFDVPGHKMGRIHNEFTDLIGIKVYQADINAPIGIDNLYKGTGIFYINECITLKKKNNNKNKNAK